MLVKQALTEFLNQQLGQHWQLHPLRQGEVNNAWRVDQYAEPGAACTASQSFFLKAQGPATYNAIARADEVRLQRELHEAGLAPKVLAHSADFRFILQQWIEAPTLAHSALETQLSTFAKVLARVHQARPQLTPWSLRERVEWYLAGANAATADRFRGELGRFDPLFVAWDRDPCVFVHNDLAAEHVFMSEPPCLVDWEYAGYGHPLFDIASTAVTNRLSDSATRELCKLYQQAAARHVNENELTFWCQLVVVVNELWLAAQQSSNGI